MMLLGFLAILCICQSGCFYWTRKNWHDTHMREAPDSIGSVHVSAEGDLCVIYSAWLHRRGFSRTEFGKFPDVRHLRGTGKAERAIILTRDDLRRLTSNANSNEIFTVSSEALQAYVLPSDITKRTFDQDLVKQLTSGWREAPITRFEPYERDWNLSVDENEAKEQARWEKMQTEARNVGAACALGKMAWLAVPDSAGDRVILELPYRQRRAPRNYVVRVLLTPPAAALDFGEIAFIGAGATVTSPMWVALYIMLGPRVFGLD